MPCTQTETNSVKITNKNGIITDVPINTNQFLGQTNAAGSALSAISLIATGSTTLSANVNTISINSPVVTNFLQISGGSLTGGLSALNARGGRFVTDVTPVNPSDVVNLSYVTQFNTCTTPSYIQTNFVNVSGDTMTGVLYGTAFRAAQGVPNGDFFHEFTNGYAFGTDSDTGIFSPVVGSVALYGNNNELLRGYYSSGAPRIGIGTTTPSANLEVTSLAPVIGLTDTGNTSSKFQIGNGSGKFFIYDVVNNAYPVSVNPSALNNQLLNIYNGNIGIGVSTPVFTLDARGDVNIGDPTQGTINTSGNKLWFGGSDNTDALYTYRYNVAANQTEWRFNVGDDIGTGTGYTDSFVVGNFPSGSTTWTSWMRVGSNTTTFSGTGVFANSVNSPSFYAGQAAPTATNELTRKDYVDNKSLSAAPPGQVAFFATNTAPPGWLKANGAVLPRTGAYANLFNAIGLTWWKAGDGSGNFRLPDLRGQFIRGWNDGIAQSMGTSTNPAVIPTTDAGRAFGSNQTDSFASHNHGITDPGHSHTITDPGHHHKYTAPDTNYNDEEYVISQDINGAKAVSAGTTLITTLTSTGITINSNTTGITTNAAGSIENRPVNTALLACIKY